MVDTPSAPSAPVGSGGLSGVAGPLALYTLVRLLLTVAIALLITAFDVPFIVALAFAVVLQMPLSWLLLGGLRAKVTVALAASTARRRQERERLRAALSGEQDPADR